MILTNISQTTVSYSLHTGFKFHKTMVFPTTLILTKLRHLIVSYYNYTEGILIVKDQIILNDHH